MRVAEVRSKILTPLETTGGNSFSLEGFEKRLFTFQNFTQGDFHSTGGIQMSFLGFIIPLEGFRYPSWGVIISREKEFPPVVSSGVKVLLRTSVTQ